ncbi:MAG: DUF4783 domain-containing protein [Bacteroidales bacterium]|nr:DUF4783 domain-containing protein [Candidatus Equibacterium intestinale]
MKKTLLISLMMVLSVFKFNACAAEEGDVFIPIAKYMEAGDSEKLSAWFGENLQVDVLGQINSCTRTQAKLIMKNFFAKYTPKSFKIVHKSGRPPMNYAVANLDAGGSKFRVIIYVKTVDGKNEIQQIRIEEQ